jgi:hypothetical protein
VLSLLCIVGVLASIAAFLIGFVPPSQFGGGGTSTYILIVGGGVLIIGFLIPGATYAMRKPSWKTAEGLEDEEGPVAAAETPSVGEPQAPRFAPAEGGADEQEIAPSMTASDGGTPPPAGGGGFDPEQHPTPDHPTRRKFIYMGIGVVLGAVLVYGLAAWDQQEDTEEAQAKADQVIASFEGAGYTPPSKDLLVNLFGTDGGNACVDPGAELNEALHRQHLANGAAQVGLRPVISDEDVVRGGLLILDVYCPDKANEVRAYIEEELKYDDVVHE